MRRDQDDWAARAPEGVGAAAWTQAIERIAAARAACEALGDLELARHTGRRLLTAIACASDAILADDAKTLQAAPEKVAGFFDKSASAYAAAIDGLHKHAVLADAAAANAMPPGEPRAVHPLAASLAAWRAAARE